MYSTWSSCLLGVLAAIGLGSLDGAGSEGNAILVAAGVGVASVDP